MRYAVLFVLLATPAWALTDLSATDHAADVTATSVFAAGTSAAAGITGYYDAADFTAYLDTLYLGIFSDSAGLAAALSDETGSGGGFVRATSPTLTTPNLGTPSALVLTNATGLPGGGLSIASEAQGDILYRNASTWVRLGAGTNGQFLQTQGAGANPQWATASGSGDVTGVGDCASGACLDGTSDGGSYVRIYDGDSHYMQLDVENIAANYTISFPPTAGTSGQLFQSDGDNTTSWTSTINLQFTGAIGEVLLGDSDAAGAASTDEDSASVKTNMSTTTEDAEVSDWWVTSFGAATAGTEYTSLFWDGSDEALEIGTQTDATSPVTVAGSECLQIDTNTGTDNQVEIGNCTSSSGVTQLSFGALNVVTTGTITGNAPVATSTGGALAVNSVTIATAAGDYDLPDNCDSATGAWVMLYVRDVSETASLTVSAAEDTIVYKGLSLNADDELDSPGAAQDSVVVVCMEANKWYVTANSGDWTNGGAAD